MIARASQGKLGLPDRDYYFKQDDKSQKIRAAYVTHIERLFSIVAREQRRQRRADCNARGDATG